LLSNYSITHKYPQKFEADSLSAGDEDSLSARGSCRDLTLKEQSYKKNNRYVVFMNHETHEVRVIDTVKARYDRMRHRVKAWADILGDIPNARLVMVGLTYRPGLDYQPNDIRDFMSKVKRKLGINLLGYAWVAELQQRGVLHYHVLLYLKKGTRFPLPDKAGWWPHGSSSVSSAKSPYYVLSYTKKRYQKDYDKFPVGARAYAVWIQERILSVNLRLLSLKKWERGIVESEGWDALPFYRQMHRDCNKWRMMGYHGDLEDAEASCEYWLDRLDDSDRIMQGRPEGANEVSLPLHDTT
jgi:hypothetical protein